MTVHSRAPLRIDFAGGWSDVPDFADGEGGTVVNAAIRLHVHVDFVLGGKTIRLHAADLREHVTIKSASEIVYGGKLDLHAAALRMLPVTGGIEIISCSEAPAGSGLGGSGALDVALLAGLARCRHDQYDREELAELGFLLETSELHLAGGRQDQYAAALGGFHKLDFQNGAVSALRLSIPAAATDDLAKHIVLIYTGHTHFSSQTHSRVWQAYDDGDPRVVEAIREIRDVARMAGDVLEAGNWRRLAELIDENWRCQQRLDGTMATPVTRTIEGAIRQAGAWGLKATGAGAGGCLVALCPPEVRGVVVDAATAAGGTVLPCEFTTDGVTVWEEESDDDG
ncbi:MAG: hypothetical protein ACE5HT_00100 [Gemmatimonadales bacterium]